MSYAELVDLFFAEHNPCEKSWSRQYMTALWVHGDEQKKIAEAARDRVAKARGSKVETPILPFAGFTVAEDYHQKYSLRSEAALMKEFDRLYPKASDFRESTAAARVNAYLAGNVKPSEIEQDLRDAGLDADAVKRIVDKLPKR